MASLERKIQKIVDILVPRKKRHDTRDMAIDATALDFLAHGPDNGVLNLSTLNESGKPKEIPEDNES